jgi:hypothetical protein
MGGTFVQNKFTTEDTLSLFEHIFTKWATNVCSHKYEAHMFSKYYTLWAN